MALCCGRVPRCRDKAPAAEALMTRFGNTAPIATCGSQIHLNVALLFVIVNSYRLAFLGSVPGFRASHAFFTSAILRTECFTTLPRVLFGNSSTSATKRGTANVESLEAANSRSFPGATVSPGSRTTTAHTSSSPKSRVPRLPPLPEPKGVRYCILYVLGRKVLPESPDDALAAPGKVEPAELIQPTVITGVEPQVPRALNCGFGVSPVSFKHDMRIPWPTDNLAHSSCLQLAIMHVEYLYLEGVSDVASTLLTGWVFLAI